MNMGQWSAGVSLKPMRLNKTDIKFVGREDELNRIEVHFAIIML